MPKDDFDITDVSDLPEDVRPKGATPTKGRSKWADMIGEAGRPLKAAEFRVAIYRKTGVNKPAAVISNQLCNAAKRGAIVRVSQGVYDLPENVEGESDD